MQTDRQTDTLITIFNTTLREPFSMEIGHESASVKRVPHGPMDA